jgi:hypothetical protein
MKRELRDLVVSMIAVEAEEGPESADAVFDEISENEFAFIEGIDAVAARVTGGVRGRPVPERAQIESPSARMHSIRCSTCPRLQQVGTLSGITTQLTSVSVGTQTVE